MLADEPTAAAMAVIAKQTLDRRADGGTPYGTPEVEPLDTSVDAATGTVRVRFVFDFMVRHGAQSGSDTYYHHVFAAWATLCAGAIVASRVVPLHQVYVSEFDVELAPDAGRYDSTVLLRNVAAQCRNDGWHGE
jgi:hypothetical protein